MTSAPLALRLGPGTPPLRGVGVVVNPQCLRPQQGSIDERRCLCVLRSVEQPARKLDMSSVIVIAFLVGVAWGTFGGMYRAGQAKDWGWFWAILLVWLVGFGWLVGWIYLLGPGKRRATQGIESSASARATFCGSCGVALAPAVQFCGSCGSPVSS